MIRKCLIFAFIFFFFSMIFQFGINFFKTDHNIEYILSSDDVKYSIKEIYKKKANVDYYYFDLLHNDIHFLFEENNIFNKQKQVIKSVKTYEVGDLECATLVYINGKKSDLICAKDENLYSYVALKDSYDFSEIAKDRILRENKAVIEKDGVTLYSSYIYDDEYLLMHDKRKILKYSPNGYLGSFVFSSKKNADRNYGVLIDNFYVVPKLNSNGKIVTFCVFNVELGTVYEIDSPVSLSLDLVNLGVHDNILYVFDKNYLIELSIDIYDRKIKIIAEKTGDGLIYKNGELQYVNIEEINKNNLIFDYSNSKYKDIDYDQIFTFEKYAIYVKDNIFYKVYANELKRPIYLFSIENIKDVKIKNDRIYFTVNDILYRFDDSGIYSLAKKDSFSTISSNSYDIYISE